MRIISTEEYNNLMKMKSNYLHLLLKPLQGAFEKVTDDDLLRENGLLYAENERLKEDMRRIKDIYTSMQFSAPENMYIFIEQLGEILDKENNNDTKRNSQLLNN